MSKFDIATASMADLLAFFNSKTDKPVKRFADRKTAERRVLALMGSAPATVVAAPPVAAALASIDLSTAPGLTAGANPKDTEDMAKKPAKAKKAAKKPAADRSKAVAASWADKKVATARATHNAVKVGGETYKSTRAAFKALDLPPGRCISFRGKLKASGAETFTTDDGKKFNFKLVPKE